MTASFYLSQRCSRVLHIDLAVVRNGRPDGDGLTGHVASAVKPDPAGHRAGGHAGQSDFVFDLAVERLLKRV